MYIIIWNEFRGSMRIWIETYEIANYWSQKSWSCIIVFITSRFLFVSLSKWHFENIRFNYLYRCSFNISCSSYSGRPVSFNIACSNPKLIASSLSINTLKILSDYNQLRKFLLLRENRVTCSLGIPLLYSILF